jgi:Fe-S-cluster containining protein
MRLESYDCKLYDKEKGKCGDYENRPMICRETKCAALYTSDEKEQKQIIDRIKNEKLLCLKIK